MEIEYHMAYDGAKTGGPETLLLREKPPAQHPIQ